MDDRQEALYAKREIKRAELAAMLSERGIGSAKQIELQERLQQLNEKQIELLDRVIERTDGPASVPLELRREAITKRRLDVESYLVGKRTSWAFHSCMVHTLQTKTSVACLHTNLPYRIPDREFQLKIGDFRVLRRVNSRVLMRM